jgi:hypothetical protein
MENCNESNRYGGRPHGMGMFIPLLALPLIIGFVKHAARRQHMMMHGMYGAPGEHGEHGERSEYFNQRRAAFEERIMPIFTELHKKAHAAEAKAAEAQPETGTPA